MYEMVSDVIAMIDKARAKTMYDIPILEEKDPDDGGH